MKLPESMTRGRRSLSRARTLALMIVAIGVAPGCGEVGAPAAPDFRTPLLQPAALFEPSHSIGSEDVITDDERSAARLVTRALAMSLREASAREHIKQGLAGSGAPELKLHLATFLTGRGLPLLDAVQRRSGVNATDLQRALARARDLELYMPVRSHRAVWNGASAPLVAFSLREDESPEAFDSLGQARVLNRLFAPTDPVLVLVPVETDFERQKGINLRGFAERGCVAGTLETLGAAERRCEWSGAQGTSGRLTGGRPETATECINSYMCEQSDGIRVTEIQLNDDECGGECWVNGDPEYQIHAYARKSAGAPGTGYDYQCAGKNVGVNQPGSPDVAFGFGMLGKRWVGSAMLLSKERLGAIAIADTSFLLQLWEDDTDGCRNTAKGFDVSSLTLDGKLVIPVMGFGLINNTIEDSFGVLGAVISFNLLGDILTGGDDFIGTIVDKTKTPFSYSSNAGRSTVIVRGGRYKGFAAINYYQAGTSQAGPVASLAITPDSPKIPVGYTRQLGVIALDPSGFAVSGVTPSWTSSNTKVATVDVTGRVSGLVAGSATITAKASGISAAMSVSVVTLGVPASMTISPPTLSMVSSGVQQLVAHLYDSNGFELPITGGTVWSSANNSVCRVDGAGVVTAIAGGQTSITAVNDTFSRSVVCYVSSGTAWRAHGGDPEATGRNQSTRKNRTKHAFN